MCFKRKNGCCFESNVSKSSYVLLGTGSCLLCFRLALFCAECCLLLFCWKSCALSAAGLCVCFVLLLDEYCEVWCCWKLFVLGARIAFFYMLLAVLCISVLHVISSASEILFLAVSVFVMLCVLP